jgi:CHASE3 domain sensor protein
MDNVAQSSRTPRRWPIFGGFAVLGIIMIAAAAGAVWQASVNNSDLDEMESHSTAVALLQDTEEEAGAAALLLQQYVAEGDDTLIPEIQSHASAAMESLTGAVVQGGVEGIDKIAADGAGLTDGMGQIIALRQSGDVQGAAAVMEEIAPAFEKVTLGLEAAIALELEQVSALQSSADRADKISSWLLIVTAVAGATLGMWAIALVTRSLIRRRASKPAVTI